MSNELVDTTLIRCPRCGQMKEPDKVDKHLCKECSAAQTNRARRLNNVAKKDYVANALANDIDLWVQQPGETQFEFSIWVAYRDSYPGHRATYRQVAESLDTTTAAVKRVAMGWDFATRMQAWIDHVDNVTLIKRHEEILDMNKEYIDISVGIRNKLHTAINNIDPYELDAREIVALARLANETESKARLDTLEHEELHNSLTSGNTNKSVKTDSTDQADLGDVVSILAKAGVLEGFSRVGIKSTTEVALVDNKNNVSNIVIDKEE